MRTSAPRQDWILGYMLPKDQRCWGSHHPGRTFGCPCLVVEDASILHHRCGNLLRLDKLLDFCCVWFVQVMETQLYFCIIKSDLDIWSQEGEVALKFLMIRGVEGGVSLELHGEGDPVGGGRSGGGDLNGEFKLTLLRSQWVVLRRFSFFSPHL